jgi:hypothetical protein
MRAELIKICFHRLRWVICECLIVKKPWTGNSEGNGRENEWELKVKAIMNYEPLDSLSIFRTEKIVFTVIRS